MAGPASHAVVAAAAHRRLIGGLSAAHRPPLGACRGGASFGRVLRLFAYDGRPARASAQIDSTPGPN